MTRNINMRPTSVSLWSHAWRQLRKNRMAIFGLVILIIIGGMCAFAPFIVKYPYQEQHLTQAGLPPSTDHWFGTDLLGRDLFSRILYGGRISFLVAIVASLVSLFIGVTYGAVSGWVGGRTDKFMMRVVEIVYSLPYTIFVILLMVFVGRGLLPLFLAIGAVEWLTMSRLVRGQVMCVKNLSFVDAARVLGQSNTQVIRKQVIPNVMGTIIVTLTLTIPNVMLLESFISFLGLGVQSPMTSWGDLINEGALSLETSPWLITFPSVFFSLTLFSLNFLGDGLRDALDPQSLKTA